MDVAVEMILGPYRGHTLPRELSEAQYLEATGQGRIVRETAVAAAVETPEGPSLADMTKAELIALADERGIKVTRADGEGVPRKVDYLNALT